MINYYKRSKKAFKKYIKANPYCTKDEWDKYAKENCLFSANTLMFHLFNEDVIKYLNKKQKDKFEYLKSIFIIIPSKEMRILSKIIKINNTKEEKIKWKIILKL